MMPINKFRIVVGRSCHRNTSHAAHNSQRDGDADGVTANLNRAYQAARSMLGAQRRNFPTGTSSLANLTRAWRLRHVVGERMQQRAKDDADDLLGSPTQALAELNRLRTIADSLTDHRGRIVADILFVSSLNTLEQWKTNQAMVNQPGVGR